MAGMTAIIGYRVIGLRRRRSAFYGRRAIGVLQAVIMAGMAAIGVRILVFKIGRAHV